MKRQSRCKKIFVYTFAVSVCFAVTITVGVMILCFVTCPILQAKLEKELYFDFRKVQYGLLGLVSLVIIMSFTFCFCNQYYMPVFCEKNVTDDSDEFPNDVDFHKTPKYDTKISTIQPGSKNQFYSSDKETVFTISEKSNNKYLLGLNDNTLPRHSNLEECSVHNSGAKKKRSLTISKCTSITNSKSLPTSQEKSENIRRLSLQHQKKKNSHNEDTGSSLESDNDIKEMCSTLADAIERRNIQEVPSASNTVTPFSRESSFQGLPNFGSFNDYLHLVNIQTPLSPKEHFFK